MKRRHTSLFNLLDILAPLKSFKYRLSSKKAPWFDHECILSKRSVRKFERAFRSSLSLSSMEGMERLAHISPSLLFNEHSSYLRQFLFLILKIDGLPYLNFFIKILLLQLSLLMNILILLLIKSIIFVLSLKQHYSFIH